jgi:hypothetical protein
MSKLIKYIPVFSLWLAGLALVTHLIIPHDHHLAEACANQEETCPVSDKNTGNHHGFPVHCHAFNDIASEKAIIFPLLKKNQSDNSSVTRQSNTLVIESGVFQKTIFDIYSSFTDSYLLEYSSLRAPPSII